jgi:hypothetical protein
MPLVTRPDGSTAEVDALNPGDQLASGSGSILDRGGVDMGQESTQITTPQVLHPGTDDNALVPGPIAPIPIFRRTTAPRYAQPTPRLRNTTRY